MERKLEEIVRYNEELQKFIFTLTRDNGMKDEILFETLKKALSLAPKEDVPLREELFSIARSETMKYYRTHQKPPMEALAPLKLEVSSNREDFSLLEQLTSREVIQCLNALEKNHARVFRCHLLYGVPLEELGRIWDVQQETLTTYYESALCNLVEAAQQCLAKRSSED